MWKTLRSRSQLTKRFISINLWIKWSTPTLKKSSIFRLIEGTRLSDHQEMVSKSLLNLKAEQTSFLVSSLKSVTLLQCLLLSNLSLNQKLPPFQHPSKVLHLLQKSKLYKSSTHQKCSTLHLSIVKSPQKGNIQKAQESTNLQDHLALLHLNHPNLKSRSVMHIKPYKILHKNH